MVKAPGFSDYDCWDKGIDLESRSAIMQSGKVKDDMFQHIKVLGQVQEILGDFN